MATITTKYSIGDTVYLASTATERKQHPCPDCKGSKKWKAVSPAGLEYEFACPRCAAGYRSRDELSLDYTAAVAVTRKLTIGSVQYNSASGAWDNGARYMCRETGIGSGSVYSESELFETEEAAFQAATAKAASQNETSECVTQYNKSLQISDYQLENALMKSADDERRRAGQMLWNINDLFEKIAEASDLEAAREAVEDYKLFDWERDRTKAEEVVSSLHIPQE